MMTNPLALPVLAVLLLTFGTNDAGARDLDSDLGAIERSVQERITERLSTLQRGLARGRDRVFDRLSTSPRRSQGEIAVRTEPNLGRPARLEEDQDEGPWLTTSAKQFINIKKIGYFRGNSKTVNGVQASASLGRTRSL